METKRTHYRMYKAGRRWVFACAIVLALGGGAVTAHADASDAGIDNNTDSSLVKSGSDSDGTGSGASDADKDNELTKTDVKSTGDLTNKDSNTGTNLTGGTKVVTNVKTAVGSRKMLALQRPQGRMGAVAATDKGTTTPSSNPVTTPTTSTVTPTATKTSATVKAALARLAAAAKKTTVTTALTPYAESGIQAGGSVYDDYPDLDNILGVSSVFHIFAREAELNAHTNGNVAVQNLIGNVNFGTNIIEELLDKDISYIQNITNIAGSSFVSGGDTRENKVVFGDGIDIDISNPNRPMVNGVYIDHLLAQEVYQDQIGQTYIDFDAEFARLKKVNQQLAESSSTASYDVSDFPDQNNRVIDVSDLKPNADNKIIINITADMLTGNTPLTIAGLSPEESGTTVIINVDTQGQSDLDLKSQIKIKYSDGSDRDNQETEDFGDNHLLWNFYDSTASDKQYGGTITIDAPFQGSILAPSAEIVANQNLDGNIIADKVIINAESHRWDLQDHTDEEEDGNENEFEIGVPLPGIDVQFPEEPEGPDTETPGTENPDTEKPGTEIPGEPNEGTDEGDEDLYEHERPDYEDNFEDDLIDFESESPSEAHADEEALLNRVDAAIAQARADGNSALVARLEAIRGDILAALGLSDGLPQTGEASDNWLRVVGLALAGGVLSTLGIARRRRHN
ncbi:collagen-binding domain-containing protein [Levilactobacillus tangyuanensis]|uniref:Collagen-binding domain-containing protein n=1 Tax=Levilactobacillus tangyuanensis TaxID=2486021 RepID=A0ABW1TL96_9LACO|nr:collagen-binding domain-containing protein [Levilactobacillus tangyuanensis]